MAGYHFTFTIPPDIRAYAGRCERCGSAFGVLQLDDLTMHPIFCPYCAARPEYRDADTIPDSEQVSN